MSQRLVASKCTRCSRPLTDPVSITLGVGPECRKKMGFTEEIENNARLRDLCAEANVRAFGHDYWNALVAINEVRIMGFSNLATALEGAVKSICKKQENGLRLSVVTLITVGEKIVVNAPYKAEALPSWRGLMQWNKEAKHYEAPAATFNRRGFFEHLRLHYKGCMVMGPKGVFWPGVYEEPVRHGQVGFCGVGADGLPCFEQAC